MEKLEKTIYCYRTYDGEIFKTEEAAKQHELELCHKRIYVNRKDYDKYKIFKVENEYELRAIFMFITEQIDDIKITSYPTILACSWDDNDKRYRYILLDDLIKKYEEKVKALKEINDINYWR